nr:hypothetical protein [Tanacetum cinerariifolium]
MQPYRIKFGMDKEVYVTSDEPTVGTQPNKGVVDDSQPKGWSEDNEVNAMAMVNHDKIENSDFVLPVTAIHAMKHKFKNSLVGFSLVLEQGPWLIRNIPLMLTKWSPNMSLSKDKVTKVPEWVKLHKVPVVAYSKDGLSLFATQIGNPIMLDAFTRGYNAVPNIDDEVVSHILEKIKVEYEWKPPHCLECHNEGNNVENNNGVKLKNLFEKLNEITSIVDPSGDDGEAAAFGDTNKKDNTDKDDSDRDVEEPYRISNHSPAVLKLPTLTSPKPKPFKFFNFLAFKTRFIEVMESHWNTQIDGHNMFKVVSKMKLLKKPLRKLLHDQGNLHERVNQLRLELDEVHKALDTNPADFILREEECVYVQAFNEAKLDEERFLKQKAKVDWLEVGYTNSAYFHKTIKCRNQRSRIDSILNTNNVEVSGSLVPDVFVSHYEQFLAAMFDIGDDRALGPDGYTSVFFKKGWNIAGDDICNAVRDFFSNGLLLKEINHTFLALIPKVSTPLRVNDYRPISYCNVIYKCISKIITNRIMEGMKEVVSDNQSAFIPSRRISDNILITQELMHNYHRNRGSPQCAIKIDIQKVYDTVDWKFLENILIKFGFHNTMVKWVMACVSSTSFSLSINGFMDFFKGKRGLRQEFFRYHRYCEEIQLINLCFADDLFIFAHGDVESSRVIMDSLEEFKLTSGLIPSIPKSTTYFCNVLNHNKVAILSIVPFSEGELPVKYLGAPFISSGLLNRDYLVSKGTWSWPQSWLLKAPDLGLITCPSLVSSVADLWQWRDRNGNISSFSVAKLGKPLDRVVIWWRGLGLFGFHIIFIIMLSIFAKVWSYVRDLASMDLISPVMQDILLYLLPMGDKRTVKSVFGKLILATSAYFIWMERNNRTFKNTSRSPEDIRDLIMVTVRLKLISFRFKNTNVVRQLLER